MPTFPDSRLLGHLTIAGIVSFGSMCESQAESSFLAFALLRTSESDESRMNLSKWIMKQYWRVGTIRALLSLALGMFVLGKLYSNYVPILMGLGLLGALILGSLLTLLFMGVGWAYDEKLQLWNESVVVQTENYPYAFVPDYRMYASDYPMLYSILYTLRGALLRLGLDARCVNDLALYLERLFKKQPSNKKDILSSEGESGMFLHAHPLLPGSAPDAKPSYSLGTRLKRSFQ